MKPSIGRIVHFVSSAGICVAAIVTKVTSDTVVNLTLFQDVDNNDSTFQVNILWSEKNSLLSWHWPEII